MNEKRRKKGGEKEEVEERERPGGNPKGRELEDDGRRYIKRGAEWG